MRWYKTFFFFSNLKKGKPDLGVDDSNTPENKIDIIDHQEEYEQYFKELATNEELYDLDVIRSQSKGKGIDYSEVEKYKWEDSPTPKASMSRLPSEQTIMVPISKD